MKKELKILKKADKLKHNHSIMSLIIGRRRIGKTTLSLKVNKNSIEQAITNHESLHLLLDLPLTKQICYLCYHKFFQI